MTPFFNNIERIELLRAVVESWIGTPFIPNGESKCFGVSCQTLTGCILRECGHLPMDFSIPHGPMDWVGESLIEKSMNLHPEKFMRFNGVLQPGDVIGFKFGKCVKHLGTLVARDKFVHVFDRLRYGVAYGTLRDPTYGARIGAVWRPIV